MSWFSSLFQSGTAFYGDPFGPLVDVVSDWGWSLLPQFPGSIRSGTGSASPGPPVGASPRQPAVPVEVVYGRESGTGAPSSGVYPVFPGPEPARRVEVPREIVIVGDVATEVERHPEGDFPAGSIFAPGREWSDELDADPQEDDVAIDWGGVLDWGLETLAGQQPWQTFGAANVAGPAGLGFAPPNISLPSPSGVPGRPTTITGYSGGSAVTGDNCGNRRYVTLDRETGKISCKRRRRRRLLTNRDLADLASLKTITGGGAALNAAVIRAVR